MLSIEIIGACVGIVATVLGGVWFIVNKAFGVGRFSHRIDEVDKRTVNAACDLHSKDITAMKGDIRTIRTDVAAIGVAGESNAKDIGTMKDDIRMIRTDVATISVAGESHGKDIGSMNTDIQTIKTDVSAVNASVESHGKDIDSMKGDIRTMKYDIVAIKSLLTMKHKDAASLFSIKNSPRQLNDIGKRVMGDMKGAEFLDEHKDFFFTLIDAYNPKTALDVENAAHAVCVSNTDNDMFNGLKLFVYNSPSYLVKDASGHERPYDLSLSDVCFILSLPLRDMYLKEHPEILTE